MRAVPAMLGKPPDRVQRRIIGHHRLHHRCRDDTPDPATP